MLTSSGPQSQQQLPHQADHHQQCTDISELQGTMTSRYTVTSPALLPGVRCCVDASTTPEQPGHVMIDPVMEDKEESEVEILDEAPAVFSKTVKKKDIKVTEKLDDAFLRRSKRVSNKAQGFKNEESAKKHKEKKVIKKTTKKGKVTSKNSNPEESTPLAVIPPAPYLSKDVLQGIGEGFLQIQPVAVSTALLQEDDIDE